MKAIDKEDFIALLKMGIRESVLKREFDLSDEEINAYRRIIAVREEISSNIKSKNNENIQRIIKKFRKKDVLVEYIASVLEENGDSFLKSLDEDFKERLELLLTEYDIDFSKGVTENNNKGGAKENEEFADKRIDLTDEEIEKLRQEAEKGTINKKNIFAFTLYRTGRIEEARDYLENLVSTTKSYTAFRQLIYLEKQEGNLEDAKIWALEAEEQFPNNMGLKEVEFRIARQERNVDEMLQIAREIKALNSTNTKYEEIALKMKREEER